MTRFFRHLIRGFATLRRNQNLKGAKPSSSRWLQRRNKDPLILQSKLDNYRARSAYKLIEINDKFHLLKSKTTVIDLGARPGSWSQVASNIIGTNKYTLDELASWKHGMILAVDKEEIEDIPGVFIIDRVDITTELAHRKISNFLAGHKVDLVMSDMAPNASGMRLLDHQRIIGLGYAALSVSKLYLKDKGNFICKLWDGSSLNLFKSEVKSCFNSVDEIRLKSTLKESSELYVVGLNYKNNQ